MPEELNRAIALNKVFDDLEEIEPPAGLASAAIKKARKRKFPVFIYASAGVAAAAVLFAVLITGLGSGMQNSEMDRSTKDMALTMTTEDTADGADDMAAGSAENAVTMDSAAQDEAASTTDDVLEAAPQEADMAEDTAADDTADAGMVPAATYYYIPAEVSGPFWDALDAFIKKNDISTDYAYDGADNVSFYIEEPYLDGLIALTEEYGIDDEDLLPGMYVTFVFNVE